MVNTKALEELLDILRDKGVTSFSCPEFSLVMGPEPQTEVDEDISEAIKESKAEARMPRVAAGTLLGHTSLWPKGMPSFPGSERSTPTHTPTHSDEYEE